jgi:hypothetical protein
MLVLGLAVAGSHLFFQHPHERSLHHQFAVPADPQRIKLGILGRGWPEAHDQHPAALRRKIAGVFFIGFFI